MSTGGFDPDQEIESDPFIPARQKMKSDEALASFGKAISNHLIDLETMTITEIRKRDKEISKRMEEKHWDGQNCWQTVGMNGNTPKDKSVPFRVDWTKRFISRISWRATRGLIGEERI